VLPWPRGQAGEDAYPGTLVVGEIRQGIERVRPRDPQQADALERWLSGVLAAYRDRILAVTVELVQEWGRMNASPRRPPVVDGFMAATARVPA
jgi:predicted nucleic acid-binding protein